MEDDMEWKGKYKSEILMVCHMEAQALYEVGAISEKEMREADRDCLVKEPKASYKTKKSQKTGYAASNH